MDAASFTDVSFIATFPIFELTVQGPFRLSGKYSKADASLQHHGRVSPARVEYVSGELNFLV